MPTPKKLPFVIHGGEGSVGYTKLVDFVEATKEARLPNGDAVRTFLDQNIQAQQDKIREALKALREPLPLPDSISTPAFPDGKTTAYPVSKEEILSGAQKTADDLLETRNLRANYEELKAAAKAAGVDIAGKEEALVHASLKDHGKVLDTLERIKSHKDAIAVANHRPQFYGMRERQALDLGEVASKLGQTVRKGMASPVGRAVSKGMNAAGKVLSPQAFLDVAQMAEPNRQDIGFMGVGYGNPRSADEQAAHPAALNMVYDAIKRKLTGK